MINALKTANELIIMWQFLSGGENHADEQVKIIAIGEASAIDSSINELHEMYLGVGAERKSIGGK